MSVMDDSSGFSTGKANAPTSNESGDISRLQQWIDHSDWDVFETKFPSNDDIEICERALKSGTILPILAEAAVDSQVDQSASSSLQNSSHGEAAAERYRNPQILGVGGYGVVFAAEDSRLGIPVALKFLRPSHHNSREYRSRFLSEAKLAASLSHPGIIRIYDVGRIDNLLFISSARIDAGSLAKWISREQKALGPRQAAWFVHELAEAVSYAHSVGMLHRDLKPANVLLEPCAPTESEGFGYRPILTDFGLAKRMEGMGDQTNWSIDGQPIGTTRYMSPEQANGQANQVSSVSDVFALGIILYELVVGKVPFDGPTPHAIRQAIIEGRLIRPRSVRPQIPVDLEAIILKSLTPKATDRYQTMREFRLDLRRYLDGEPIEAKKSTLMRRFGYLVRKHPITATVASLTIALNLTALIGLGYAVREGNRALEIEQKATKQVQTALTNEQAAFNRYVASEESRKQVLRDVVTLYSDVTDDIIAGKKVGIAEMIPSLEKTAAALEAFIKENPNDAQSLHRLNVVQHYLSIGYNFHGKLSDSIAARRKAVSAIEKLVEQMPTNDRYRFDRFMSYFLLGQLYTSPQCQSTEERGLARKNLEIALQEIEGLCKRDANNLGHLEGRLSAKRVLSFPESGLTKLERLALRESIVREATELTQRYPDRESFHGIATSTGMQLAQDYISLDRNEDAKIAGRQAIDLFDRTRRPIPDEVGRLDHALGVLVAWYHILEKVGEFAEANKIAEESVVIEDQILRIADLERFHIVRIDSYLFRIRMSKRIDDAPKTETITEQMTTSIENSRKNKVAYTSSVDFLRTLIDDKEIGAEVRACLAALKEEVD